MSMSLWFLQFFFHIPTFDSVKCRQRSTILCIQRSSAVYDSIGIISRSLLLFSSYSCLLPTFSLNSTAKLSNLLTSQGVRVFFVFVKWKRGWRSKQPRILRETRNRKWKSRKNAKHTSRQTALRLQRNGSPSVQNERSPMKRFGGNSLSLTHCKESRFLQRTRLKIRPVPVQFVKIVRRRKRYEQQNVREKKRRHSDQSQAIGI